MDKNNFDIDIRLSKLYKIIKHIYEEKGVHLGKKGKNAKNFSKIQLKYELSPISLRRELNALVESGYLYYDCARNYKIKDVQKVYLPTSKLDEFFIKLLNELLSLACNYIRFEELENINIILLEQLNKQINLNQRQKTAIPIIQI